MSAGQSRSRSSVLPNFPRGVSALPERFEQAGVAQCVHALPEISVPVGNQLPVVRETFEWLAFEDGVVAFDVVERLRLHHEESAIDPAFANLRFFGKLLHEIAVENQSAEPGRRPHGGHRHKLAVGAVSWSSGRLLREFRVSLAGSAGAPSTVTQAARRP